MKIYQEIASLLSAIENCKEANNKEWEEKYKETLNNIMQKTAPNGAGIDNDIVLGILSNSERLFFHLDFHHMDENGFYDDDEWTTHNIEVKASLLHHIVIKVYGVNKNGIKDYLYDVMHNWLTSEYLSN